MKITDVRVLMFSCPIPTEHQHRTDLGQAVKAEACVVALGPDRRRQPPAGRGLP